MTEQDVAQPATATSVAAAADPKAELNASFDTAFAELDGGADEPERDAGGRFSARTQDEAESANDVERAAGDGEEPAAAAPTPQDDEAYEKALLALRYSGAPSALYKNASRDELIAWGTEAADRRAKTEAALEERAVRIRELEAGTKAPSEPAKPAAVDWTPHMKALADTLGLEPEAASQAFGPILDAVASQVRAEFEGRLAPIEQTTQEAQAAEGRRQISEQVRRLSEAHPKLKTDEALVAKLNAKALTLWKSGEYHDAESVYQDAARLVLKPEIPGLAAMRRNGASPPPEGRAPDREGSGDPFIDAMERVEAGDQRGARRVGSQVLWGHDGRR